MVTDLFKRYITHSSLVQVKKVSIKMAKLLWKLQNLCKFGLWEEVKLIEGDFTNRIVPVSLGGDIQKLCWQFMVRGMSTLTIVSFV